jgi:O-antigen ligase
LLGFQDLANRAEEQKAMQRIEVYNKDKLYKFFGFGLLLLMEILFSRLLVQTPSVLFLYISGFLTFILILFFNLRTGIILLVLFSPLLNFIPASVSFFPESHFSINLMGLINLSLPLFLVSYLLTHKNYKINSSLTKPILIFLGILLLTVFTSNDSWISFRHWFRLAMPISVYFLILQGFKTEMQINQLKKVLLFSSIVPLLSGFYQIFYGFPETSILYTAYKNISVNRIIGSFSHPNGYAAYLVILIPLVISFCSEKRRSNKKLFYLLFLGGMLVSLFCTYTRVAWAAFFGSLTVMGMTRYKRVYMSLIMVLLIIFLLIPSLNQAFLKRIQPDSSFYGRFSFNQLSLYLFSQKPILGHGFGAYQLLSANAFGVSESIYGRDMGVAPHNDYLLFLSETGIIGFLAFIFLIYSLLKLGNTIYKNKNLILKAEGSILLAVLTGVLIFGLTDAGFGYGGIYLWTLIGLVEAKYSMRSKV